MAADEPDVQADSDAAVKTDLTSTVGSEDMDEDRLGVDPLESGMDPPERWTASDKFGVTADEQQRGETLDQRLDEERPDVGESDGAHEAPTDEETAGD